MVNLQSLIMGIFCLATGLPMLLIAHRTRLDAKAATDARKAELAAGASERYFEEQRTLNTYPVPETTGSGECGGCCLLAVALYCWGYHCCADVISRTEKIGQT
jgi:hypothetical protein